MAGPDEVIYLNYEEFEDKVDEVSFLEPSAVRDLVRMAPEEIIRDKGTRFFKYKGVVYAETI